MKYVLPVILLLLLAGTYFNSGPVAPSADNPQEKEQETFQNITILLDLSDRIKDSGRIEKDLFIIEQLLESFEKNQKKYGYQLSKDRVSVAVAHQQDACTSLFDYGNGLSIDMSIRGMNRPLFDKRKEAFKEKVKALYQDALQCKTTGADIWSFFRDNLSACIKTPDLSQAAFKNKILILSDGYLLFDKEICRSRGVGTYMGNLDRLRHAKGWQKLFEEGSFKLQAHKNIPNANLEAWMLGVTPVNPAQYPEEFAIIKKYWATWFNDMNIKNEIHMSEENRSNLANLVERFLL